MDIPSLTWDSVVVNDPEGGEYVFWPHLPCVESPSGLVPESKFQAVAFLASSEDVWRWREELAENDLNPGAHVAAAVASGTALGRYLTDLEDLGLPGITIPDPEPIALLKLKLRKFALEPSSDDKEWAHLMIRHADYASKASTFFSFIGAGRRWKRVRSSAIRKVVPHTDLDAAYGAAAASAAAWWTEENRTWTKEIRHEADRRKMARLRGAMAEMRSGNKQSRILVPVHQPCMQGLIEVISSWPHPESCEELEEW